MSLVTFGRSLTELFSVNSETVLDDVLLNAIFKALEVRLKPLEEQRDALDAAIEAVRGVALVRINEVLIPAIESIRTVQAKGFLIAKTTKVITTPAQIGDIQTHVVSSDDERQLFTPSPITILSSGDVDDMNNYLVCRSINYDVDRGEYTFEVISVVGAPMTGNSWVVGALAGSTIAQVALLGQGRSTLTSQLTDNDLTRKATAADRLQIGTDKAEIAGFRTTAVSAKDTAVAAKNDIFTMYRGSLPTAPANGQPGQWYIDTTDKVIKTYFDGLWSPGVSVSLGGYRFGNFVATAGQTAFAISGGFTRLDVYLNGVLLAEDGDYTLSSPNFTLATGAKAGDRITARGYLLTGNIESYTKAESDATFSQYAKLTDLQTAITNLLSGAPAALDTLKELADALGGDQNFAATVTAALGNRYTRAEVDALVSNAVTNAIKTQRRITVATLYIGG